MNWGTLRDVFEDHPTCQWNWTANKWHPLELGDAVGDRKTPCCEWQLCFHSRAKALGLWERTAETLRWTQSEEELCTLSLGGVTVVVPLVTMNPQRWQVMFNLKWGAAQVVCSPHPVSPSPKQKKSGPIQKFQTYVNILCHSYLS